MIADLFKKIFKKLRKRHVKAFIKHVTFRKFFNLFLSEYERITGKSVLKSKPYLLTLDVTNACILKCPFCPTGLGKKGRKKGFMNFNDYKKIIDELKDYLFIVNLYNWGEPLIHPEISRFVKYAQDNNISTSISTNLNIFNEKLAEKLIKVRLESLIIALDGTNKSSYSKYRRRGNFNKVMENLKLILKKKKDLKSDLYVIWQFLVFRHNEKEIEKAKKIAERLGVDEIDFCIPICYDKSWQSSVKKFQRQKENCNFLWRNLIIHCDGGIAPCCYEFYKKNDFGNIFNEKFKDIWNNEKFKDARNFVVKKENKLDIICNNCDKVK